MKEFLINAKLLDNRQYKISMYARDVDTALSAVREFFNIKKLKASTTIEVSEFTPSRLMPDYRFHWLRAL